MFLGSACTCRPVYRSDMRYCAMLVVYLMLIALLYLKNKLNFCFVKYEGKKTSEKTFVLHL